MAFVADFETTTNEKDCRVWGYAICEIGNVDNITFGNSIESFMDWCKENPNNTVYFHNLKFDGEFILHYILNNGYTYKESLKDIEANQFTTLISDMGQFYSMTIVFSRYKTKLKKIIFNDSLKIIPFSVEDIAKGFGLPISKLSINYDEYRPIGHILTAQEKNYIANDVKIIAMALKTLFDQGLTKLTQGSNALYDFKTMFGIKRFERTFPQLQIDKELRRAYRGGFTYLNPRFQGR